MLLESYPNPLDYVPGDLQLPLVIELGGSWVRMPEKVLHIGELDPLLEEVCCSRLPARMARELLRQLRTA